MTRGIAGALLLARGRAAGAAAFAPTMEDARASFLAALFCLPIFLMLRLGFPAPGPQPTDALRALVADLLAYVCSWAGFALAALPMTQAIGRGMLWPRLVAAWNWVNFVQYVILGLLSVPSLLGAPGYVGDALGLAGLGYAIWMQWFAARATLQVSGLRASAFVALDLGLSVFLSGLAAQIALG